MDSSILKPASELVRTNKKHFPNESAEYRAARQNLLAEEIKAEARWAGVPIIENKALARSLYRTVEVGQAIPIDLYATVAAILAYLYRQRVEAELRERRLREASARATYQSQTSNTKGPEAVIPPYSASTQQGGFQ